MKRITLLILLAALPTSCNPSNQAELQAPPTTGVKEVFTIPGSPWTYNEIRVVFVTNQWATFVVVQDQHGYIAITRQ